MKGKSDAMKHQNGNKAKLIEHLYAVMNTELEKPYTEIDADFVNICVELILELQGKNFTLSNEEIEEKVRKIPFVDTSEIKPVAQKKSTKVSKKKILLIAAIVALLCVLLAVFSTSQYVEHWLSVMIDKYGSMFDAPVNVPFTQGNEEFIIHGKDKSYETPEEFYKEEKLQVLMPGKLPNGIKLKYISFLKEDNEIILTFDSVITGFAIYPNTCVPQIIIDSAQESFFIKDTAYYIRRIDDTNIIQIHFEYNNSYYTISGTDEQALVYIIENLEIPK